jgi:Skp family chaperone for outer membrane proteins
MLNRTASNSEMDAGLSEAHETGVAKDRIPGGSMNASSMWLGLFVGMETNLSAMRAQLQAGQAARQELERVAGERLKTIEQLECAIQEHQARAELLQAKLEARTRELNEAKFVARVGMGAIVGVQLGR